MMSAEDRLTSFPLTYSRCPACGCEETVAGKAVEEERAKGSPLPGPFSCLMRVTTAIFDPKTAQRLILPTRVPTIVSSLDACLKCGCLYCRTVEKSTARLTPGLPQNPMQRGL